MKKHVCALMLLACGAGAALGQSNYRVITRPQPFDREVLRRLNLDAAWATRLKLESNRDGIFSVQLIPTKGTPQLVVQTLFGSVLLIDAESGDVLWRTPLPKPLAQKVGANSQSIFVVRGDMLYVLNRANGLHRVYTKLKSDLLATYGYRLPAPPSAAPAVDEAGVFLAVGNRIAAYAIPDFEAAAQAKLDKREIELFTGLDESSLQPLPLWTFDTPGATVEQTPLPTPELVNVMTTDGRFMGLNRFKVFLRFTFKLDTAIIAPMSSHGLTAYAGAEDYTLYALDMHGAQVTWRFLAGAPIYRQPMVTDEDIYVLAEKIGLYRVFRNTGEEAWLNRDAEQYLASNPKLVYARDRQGKLLFLDAHRGSTLTAHDVRDWTIAVSNEWTDRIYLAAQDGQIACLRHRDYPLPVVNRTLPDLTAPPEDPDAEKKNGLDKKDTDKKEVFEDKKEADKKEADKKEADKKEADKKEADKKEADKKEADKKEKKKDEKKEEKKEENKEEKLGRANGPAQLRWGVVDEHVGLCIVRGVVRGAARCLAGVAAGVAEAPRLS